MNIEVRKAKKADLVPIRQWLEDEERREIDGNFLCNWSVIEEGAGRSLYVATVNDEIVGYLVSRSLWISILQVKYEWRGKGVGRALAEHVFKRNVRRKDWIVEIECKPHSSIPFWKKMGFTIDESGHKVLGHKILTSKFRVPSGSPTNVVVSFYPENIKWDATTKPASVHKVQGSEVAGVVYLPSPVVGAEALLENGRDMFVKIEVAGKVISAAKAKYPESTKAGVLPCSGGWWIKEVRVS